VKTLARKGGWWKRIRGRWELLLRTEARNTIRQSLHRMMRSGNEGFAFLAEVREILEPEDRGN